MSDKNVSVLDVLARLETLERKNASLEKELDKLKAQNAPENWQELILYRPLEGEGQKPIEVLWTDEETEKTRIYYRTEEPGRRDVIGLVRKVQ